MTGSDNVTIWEYIDFWLNRITSYKASSSTEKDFEVETAASARLREILRKVCEESSVFPRIAPDGENGLAATWHATEFSLEICVWDDLSSSIIARGPGAPLHLYSFDDEGAGHITTEHLKKLSDHVIRGNPRWRELFPPLE